MIVHIVTTDHNSAKVDQCVSLLFKEALSNFTLKFHMDQRSENISILAYILFYIVLSI